MTKYQLYQKKWRNSGTPEEILERKEAARLRAKLQYSIKTGNDIIEIQFNKHNTTCLLCKKKKYLNGFCNYHYSRLEYLDLSNITCHCGEKHLADGLCLNHFIEFNQDILKKIKPLLIQTLTLEKIVDYKRDILLYRIKRKHNLSPNLIFMFEVQNLFTDNRISLNVQGLNTNNLVSSSDFSMEILSYLIEGEHTI